MNLKGESMAPYFDLLSNLKSLSFYKVIFRSMIQGVSPSVFFMMEKISSFTTSMNSVLSGLDPVMMYSVGGLVLIIGFGLQD